MNKIRNASHSPTPWYPEQHPYGSMPWIVRDNKRNAVTGCIKSEVDAELIAAAPDLLRSLELTLAALRTLIKDPDSWQTVIDAKAAIDRAKGNL